MPAVLLTLFFNRVMSKVGALLWGRYIIVGKYLNAYNNFNDPIGAGSFVYIVSDRKASKCFVEQCARIR